MGGGYIVSELRAGITDVLSNAGSREFPERWKQGSSTNPDTIAREFSADI